MARVTRAGLLTEPRTTLRVITMRCYLAGVLLVLLAACSNGKQIKDLPDDDTISKKPAMWTDPGATPDKPRDAGGSDDSMDAGEDASVPDVDSGEPDAGVSDAAVDASMGDAGDAG